jgi:two-component system cell cycle response regulator DivK
MLEARTGQQGLAIAEDQDLDLILLDINLPDIDGYEVARRLRASPKSSLVRTPILALTANAMKGDEQKVIQAGCDFYMAKPINIQELIEKVESLTCQV